MTALNAPPTRDTAQVDEPRRLTAGRAVQAAAAVVAGRRYAEHTDAVPEQLVYASAVALALASVVIAGQRVTRWADGRRHPLAVDIDAADLSLLGKELLARVRAQRQARGEVAG